MGEVIQRDFGKEDREHARKLARLLGLLAEREADMLANPGEYLKMAYDELTKMLKLKWELYEAIQRPILMSPDPRDFEIEVWRVDKAEWERWKKVEAIIRAGCLD